MQRTWFAALALFLTIGSILPADDAPGIPVAQVRGMPRDIGKWPVAQQECYRSARTAMDWLRRTNKSDGRFVYGFLPALCTSMEGDSYLRQAGAAGALAAAARYFGDEAATAIARQALLTLLVETAVDPQQPQERCTAAPASLLDPVAASGALLVAIHQLAAPGKDLVEQAEQLANYLRRHQPSPGAEFWRSTGLALYGISLSHKHRPAPWKSDMLAQARGQALAQWQKEKSVLLAVALTPAFGEAYLATHDAAFAQTVFAWNDWLCSLQITQTEPLRKQFDGGFPSSQPGTAGSPDISSAYCAESLAQACRVARAANDLARHERYRRALEQALQFVLTLQYSPARTRHFADDFRPAIAGAFHASHQDGNLRLDYTEHALSALVIYLENQTDDRQALR